ncbi:MAG TPA: hypothetical protein VFP34_11020, partial [Microlunatus sp.]|nr:hypothetical protein [Microlunatus sp.]
PSRASDLCGVLPATPVLPPRRAAARRGGRTGVAGSTPQRSEARDGGSGRLDHTVNRDQPWGRTANYPPGVMR